MKLGSKLIETLEVHQELNQKLFDGTDLKEEVKSKLLEIADTFISGLDFPLNVADIRFLGSNASYNYNEHSDIDLHIISNFDLVYVDKDILQQLYNASKNSFNNNHDITIKGIPVEIYIEDMNSMNATNGSYSLLNDEWVKFPEPIEYEIPDYSKELEDRKSEINQVLLSTNKEEVEALINDIYLGRKDGLATEGEASIGNLVFKELRNLDLIQKLRDRYNELESEELTLENKLIEEVEEDATEDGQVALKEKEYREYVDTHIENVQKAYDRIVKQYAEDELTGNQLKELENNLKEHDKDKNIPFMFDAYRRNHCPINDEEKEAAEEDYAIAWEYHKNINPHHWEYWLNSEKEFADNIDEDKMKLAYFEMLCDWLSFGFRKEDTSATGESTEFETWYDENKEDIKIHPQLEEWFSGLISQILGYIKQEGETLYESKPLTNIENCNKIEEDVIIENREVGEKKMNKLEEGGMSRILQLIQQGYFGTVSASLNPLRYAFFVAKDKELIEMLNNEFSNSMNLSEEVISQLEEKYSKIVESYNKDATQQLKNSIRQTGFGYIPIEGVYTYNGTEEGSVEESLFVSVPKNIRSSFEDFRQQIINIGNTYFQESVVVGNADTSNNGEVTRDENNQLVLNASLYDCATGKVLDTDEYSTEFSGIDINAISGFLSKLVKDNNRTFTLKECDDIFMGKKIVSYTDGLKAGGIHEYWKSHKNPIAETYSRGKLQEMNYRDFKKENSFKYDYNVVLPLEMRQESDLDTYEDENGNDVEMDYDVESLRDSFDNAIREIEKSFNDEDYLKELFPTVGRGRVYPELIELNEEELIFNIGISDIVDPVERGNELNFDENEIKSQIEGFAESIVDNIGYLDADQCYDTYSGYKDEDDDPIYDTNKTGDDVSFCLYRNGDIQIKSNLTESKKLQESNLSRIFSHYQNDPFIVISAERPDKDNKKRTLNLKNDIRSAGFGYIPVDGGWKEKGVVSTEASFFIPMPSGTKYEDFFNWGIKMCKKYGQYAVLISDGNGNIAYYKDDGSIDMEFKGGISFNKNTIDKNIDDAGGVGGFTSLNRKNPNKNFQLQQLRIDRNVINNLARENDKCDVLKLYVDEFKTFNENDLQTLISTLYNSKLDLSKDSGNAELDDCKLSFNKTDDGIKVSLRESKDLIRYRNHSQKDYIFNNGYSNTVKIEESDSNFDILSKHRNADYGFIQDNDLKFIVETLYGKGTKLSEGLNDYGDLQLEYKKGRILDIKQK